MKPFKCLSIVCMTLLIGDGVAVAQMGDRVTEIEQKYEALLQELESLRAQVASIPQGPPGQRGPQGPAGPVQEMSFPQRMVVAFDGQCPDGWVEYPGASGRVVLGVNDQHLFRQTDGEESHTLSVEELPNYTLRGTATENSHSHSVSVQFSVIDGENGSENPRAGRDNGRYRTSSPKVDVGASEHEHDVVVQSGGANRPHNNMPPYIALYYCTPGE